MSKFKEEYVVTIDYKKPDGFWVMSHKLSVYVDVEHGINEKNNHNVARKIVCEQFSECRVKKVEYV